MAQCAFTWASACSALVSNAASICERTMAAWPLFQACSHVALRPLLKPCNACCIKSGPAYACAAYMYMTMRGHTSDD